MTETDKTTGKVARITNWKTGKGYFLNLDGNSNDFYGFGSCKAKLGETVDLEVSEGTGNFADKIKVDKIHCGVTVKQVEKETHDKDMEILDRSIKSGENTYFERQNLIVRQCALKAAANAVGACAEKAESKDWATLANTVCSVADQFYAWITESDQKLPEPPEEP